MVCGGGAAVRPRRASPAQSRIPLLPGTHLLQNLHPNVQLQKASGTHQAGSPLFPFSASLKSKPTRTVSSRQTLDPRRESVCHSPLGALSPPANQVSPGSYWASQS